MKKELGIGVIVEFNDGRPEQIFDNVTGTCFEHGFVHLAIKIECAKYNNEGKLIRAEVLDTVASFNQNIINSVIDKK